MSNQVKCALVFFAVFLYLNFGAGFPTILMPVVLAGGAAGLVWYVLNKKEYPYADLATGTVVRDPKYDALISGLDDEQKTLFFSLVTQREDLKRKKPVVKYSYRYGAIFFALGTIYEIIIAKATFNGSFSLPVVILVTLVGLAYGYYQEKKALEKGDSAELSTDEEILQRVLAKNKRPIVETGMYWGRDIIEFEGDKFWYDNTGKRADIVNALGDNFPLDYGFWKDMKWASTWADKIHFNGHLSIGGTMFSDFQGHMLTVGNARSGKGTTLVIPALLSLSNLFPNAPSFINLDPKGENLAITGKYLRDSCGYNVICINPFGIPEIEGFGKSGFNVFETFDANTPDFDKYADMIANAIVVSTKTSNSHFDKTSRSYISLYIRHLMTQDEEPKNFRTLYKWLRLGGDDRMNFLRKMGTNEAFDGDIKIDAFSIASQIASGAGKEVESTYSTIRAATDAFKSQQLRDSISQSDFDVTKIAHEKTAIFVCMNPSDLNDNQAWLRILFGSFIRSLTRHYSKTRKLVMVLDEFPTMGSFKEFEIMSGFMAGYNVTLWPIMQSLVQLQDLYPGSWETFVANATVRHFMGIGDNFTAKYVSDRMPVVDFKGTRGHQPLVGPEEVLTVKSILCFINGVNAPVFMRRRPYYEDDILGPNAADNPFR